MSHTRCSDTQASRTRHLVRQEPLLAGQASRCFPIRNLKHYYIIFVVPSNKLTRFSSYVRKIKIRILFELKFGFLHAYELAMPVVLIRSMLLAKLKLESTRNKSSPGKIRISVRNISRKVSYFNAGLQLEVCKCCKMHKG